MYIYVCVYVCVCVRIYKYAHTHTHTHTHTHIYIYIYIYIFTHTYILACVHTHKHTHICIHTHTRIHILCLGCEGMRWTLSFIRVSAQTAFYIRQPSSCCSHVARYNATIKFKDVHPEVRRWQLATGVGGRLVDTSFLTNRRFSSSQIKYNLCQPI